MAQTYDSADVTVIQSLITNNGLVADPNDPSSWDFATWDTNSPKQLIELDFYTSEHFEMAGDASFVGLTNLKLLLCVRNNLAKLDASDLINLEALGCDSNKLTSLNVSGCINLEFLQCPQNKLSQLDVSGLTNLWGVVCLENELTLLDVSGTNLFYLFCQDNNLTQLDVSSCINLEYFDCSYNNLTQLDVSGFTNLGSGLSCEGNNLTQLNVSGCTNLGALICSGNNLTQLDISDCISLEWLDCSENNLTALDLTGLSSLNGFMGDNQNVELTLYNNGNGTYSLPIELNAPVFGNNAIQYSGGKITSVDKAVLSTNFDVETGKNGYELSGIMSFTYSEDVGIVETHCNASVRVFPNPVSTQLKITNYELREDAEYQIYSVVGQVVMQGVLQNNIINVEALASGMYSLKIDGKVIKFVKE